MNYFTLDRKAVSKLLKVSTRTLDRYVAKKMFSTQKKNGKVYFDYREIEDYIKEKNIEVVGDENNFVKKAKIEPKTIDIEADVSYEKKDKKTPEKESYGFNEAYNNQLAIYSQKMQELELQVKMYQFMYETNHRLFVAKDDQLRVAHMRIGELEKEAEHSKPLLLNTRETLRNREEEIGHFRQLIESVEKSNNLLEKRFFDVQIVKNAYLAISSLVILFISIFFALK